MSRPYPIVKEQIRKYIEEAPVENVQILRLELEELIEECIERETPEYEKGYNSGKGSCPMIKHELIIELIDKWLRAAKEHRWTDMVDLTQISWLHEQRSTKITRTEAENKSAAAVEKISSFYGPHKIKSWEIKHIGVMGYMCKAEVEVQTKKGPKLMKATIIRETAAYEPSIFGKWGINPISAMLRG